VNSPQRDELGAGRRNVGDGEVAISSTDSRNSGLISPDGGVSPRIELIPLTRSSEEGSTIMNSSSTPAV